MKGVTTADAREPTWRGACRSPGSGTGRSTAAAATCMVAAVVVAVAGVGCADLGGPLPESAVPADSPRAARPAAATGPLRVHSENPRYFVDDAGYAVYLTGSHHWDNLAENVPPYGPFDYDGYIDFLDGHHHNFIRLWAQWGPEDPVAPQIYERTGPGLAWDGRPRFDLERFDASYFDRLRRRVRQAGERGMYVAIMLFQGWRVEDKGLGNTWERHPFHRDNNVNGVDGDVDGDGEGTEIHTLADSTILALQQAYVRRVIDTVNDLDNVLYEISNESGSHSWRWQYHMIEFIQGYQATLPQQHPAGMTAMYPHPDNTELFASPAAWISPRHTGERPYRTDPPPATGEKVIIVDSDHLWGDRITPGDWKWAWKSFLRGLNPIYMDPLEQDVRRTAVRVAMGQTRWLADRLDLARMVPRPELAATGYCLARTGADDPAIVAFQPDGGDLRVDLRGVKGTLVTQWFDPYTGELTDGSPVEGGGPRTLSAPFRGPAAVYIGARPLPERPEARSDE